MMISGELRTCFIKTEDTVDLMLVRGDIKGDRPEAVGSTGAGDEDSVLLDDLDIVLGEKCNTVVITYLSK
jgi:hypothetical protein